MGERTADLVLFGPQLCGFRLRKDIFAAQLPSLALISFNEDENITCDSMNLDHMQLFSQLECSELVSSRKKGTAWDTQTF